MVTYDFPLPDAPENLVDNGSFNLGRYKSPFKEINPLDVDLGVPHFWKNFRLKEWQHFALVTDEYYLSLALFNCKVLSLAQVCIQDVYSKAIYFYEKMSLGSVIDVPKNLDGAECSFRTDGFDLTFRNDLSQGTHQVDFDISYSSTLPNVKGTLVLQDDYRRYHPMEVCLPLVGKRAMYSHKNICPLTGELQIASRNIDFREGHSYGLSDIHKGYYPYKMKWHWATGGQVVEGKLLGFNLTNNQVEDQETYNENCFWLDGQLYSLPPVTFDFNEDDIMSPWHIYDKYGQVDLIFTPEVVRSVGLNLLILANNYQGPYGTFSGAINIPEHDIAVKLDKYRGMCEDFYLRC